MTPPSGPLLQAPLPDFGAVAYPRGASGFVQQCAWCRKVGDRAGRFRIPAPLLLDSASHGCCSVCATVLMPSRAELAADFPD